MRLHFKRVVLLGVTPSGTTILRYPKKAALSRQNYLQAYGE